MVYWHFFIFCSVPPGVVGKMQVFNTTFADSHFLLITPRSLFHSNLRLNLQGLIKKSFPDQQIETTFYIWIKSLCIFFTVTILRTALCKIIID